MRSFDDERPRERLRRLGVRTLSARELLSLIVRSGTGATSAEHIAGELMLRAGPLRRLASADVAALERVPGIGGATAASLVAAFELGRRAAVEPNDLADPIRGPEDVFRRVGARLRDVPQEEFHALLLDTRHRVIREVLITRGILDGSLVHPREVFRAAVVEGAAAVILLHNHPSGDPTPSSEDRTVTRRLAEAGRAIGIPVLDHVVIGRGRYRSLATELGP